ncbi:MAG: hypothetical protein HF962_07655 [Sulfurovum sp.]|nr:hypothetical protein [Sulfurovum sp.]
MIDGNSSKVIHLQKASAKLADRIKEFKIKAERIKEKDREKKKGILSYIFSLFVAKSSS